jgi:hypothetical protein
MQPYGATLRVMGLIFRLSIGYLKNPYIYDANEQIIPRKETVP